MSEDIYQLLGLPPAASEEQLEAAYRQKRAEYTLDAGAPADLQAIAQARLQALEEAYAAHNPTPVVAAAAPRREWLWAGAGMLLALVILAVIALTGRDSLPQPVLVTTDLPAPDLTMETFDGQTVRLADLRGKVVLVNFWATWCEPCKTETPDLVAAYTDLRDQGLEVIGVNLTNQDLDLEEIRRFIQRYQITYPIAMDRDKTIQQAFGVYPIPANFFIDPNGRVRYTRNDIVTRADIEHVLRELQP